MHTSTARDLTPPYRPAPTLQLAEPEATSAQDRAFIALQDAYRPHGGLLRSRRWPSGIRMREQGLDGDVERLLEAGQVFGFPWHDSLWLPLFQLDLSGPAVLAGPEAVVAEWGGRVDAWALACWFVLPHAGLGGRKPIECLDARLPEVLQAARLDRFVVTG